MQIAPATPLRDLQAHISAQVLLRPHEATWVSAGTKLLHAVVVPSGERVALHMMKAERTFARESSLSFGGCCTRSCNSMRGRGLVEGKS